MFVRSILEEAIIVSQYPRTGIQVRVGSRSWATVVVGSMRYIWFVRYLRFTKAFIA